MTPNRSISGTKNVPSPSPSPSPSSNRDFHSKKISPKPKISYHNDSEKSEFAIFDSEVNSIELVQLEEGEGQCSAIIHLKMS